MFSPFSSPSVVPHFPLIVYRDVVRVSIGYRLGIDWVSIGARLDRQKSITEFRPNIDQNLTLSIPRGDGKGGGMCFLPNVILSLGEESQMEQAGNRCFARPNMTSPFFYLINLENSENCYIFVAEKQLGRDERLEQGHIHSKKDFELNNIKRRGR